MRKTIPLALGVILFIGIISVSVYLLIRHFPLDEAPVSAETSVEDAIESEATEAETTAAAGYHGFVLSRGFREPVPPESLLTKEQRRDLLISLYPDEYMKMKAEKRRQRVQASWSNSTYESFLDTDDWIQMPGTFLLTGYCPCEICNGPWVGQPTASGTDLTPYRSVAVDPSVIPLGSKVMIDLPSKGWTEFVAEDTGSGVKGKHIDICVSDHEETYEVPYNGYASVMVAP